MTEYAKSAQAQFMELDKAFAIIREKRNKFLVAFQSECPHLALVECKSLGEHRGGKRVCLNCGTAEAQPVNDDGDEYNYASFGSYKRLIGKVITQADVKNISDIELRKI